MTTSADVSVRLAWPADAAAVAAVQLAAWRQRYADVLPPDVLVALPAEAFEQRWRASIDRPTQARQRVLVALERAVVRGFAAMEPSPDPDADPGRDAAVSEFAVDPAHRSQGHGSRLLHAAVDTLRADRFGRATIWLASTDAALEGFLVAQGWAADGAERQLDLDGTGAVVVRQVRLHTDLAPDQVV